MRTWLALLLALPAILTGPAFAGGVQLVHDHDGHGRHEHVLIMPASFDAAALAAGHHEQHAGHPHDGVDEADVGHGLVAVPSGSLVAWTIAWGLASATSVPRSPALGAPVLPAADCVVGTMAREGGEARPWATPSSPEHPSGAVRVLRTSGALLI